MKSILLVLNSVTLLSIGICDMASADDVVKSGRPAKMYFRCTDNFGDGYGSSGTNWDLGLVLKYEDGAAEKPDSTPFSVTVSEGTGFTQEIAEWDAFSNLENLYENDMKEENKCTLTKLNKSAQADIARYISDLAKDGLISKYDCGVIKSASRRTEFTVSATPQTITRDAKSSFKRTFMAKPQKLTFTLKDGRKLNAELKEAREEQTLGEKYALEFEAVDGKSPRTFRCD